MSVKVSAWVWHEGPQDVNGNDLVVLLALADIANDDGVCVFVRSKEEATQEALAAKARVSRRTFQRVTERLAERGLLEIRRGAQHETNTYRVLIQGGHSVASADSRGVKSDVQMRQTARSEASSVARHRDVLRKDVMGAAPSVIREDWEPSEGLVAWAAVEAPGVNVARESAAFVDYFVGEGRKHKDWDRAWKNWMRRAQSTAERFGWKPEEASVVALENATQIRLAREAAEQKRVWCEAHGVTVEEFDRRHREPGFLASLGVGRG